MPQDRSIFEADLCSLFDAEFLSSAPRLNCALTYVAQEVSGLLQQSHLAVKRDINWESFCLKAITTLKTVTTKPE